MLSLQLSSESEISLKLEVVVKVLSGNTRGEAWSLSLGHCLIYKADSPEQERCRAAGQSGIYCRATGQPHSLCRDLQPGPRTPIDPRSEPPEQAPGPLGKIDACRCLCAFPATAGIQIYVPGKIGPGVTGGGLAEEPGVWAPGSGLPFMSL